MYFMKPVQIAQLRDALGDFKSNLKKPNRPCCGFTLTELLVVVAILFILISLLLPSLRTARERVRMIQCMNNMRQIYGLSQAFYTDTGNLLPAWYYPNHPDGPEGMNAGSGSPFDWHYRHFGGMLMDMGYLPTMVQTRALLRCPSGLPPINGGINGADTNPTINFSIKDIRRLMSTSELTPPTVSITWYQYSSSSGFAYTTNYQINMNAGSFSSYHNNSVNQGCYPRPCWSSSDLGKIAYIMESNVFGINPNTTSSQYYPPGGANYIWSNLKYNPTAPHMNTTKSNIIYADGHAGILGDAYDASTGKPFPFVWE